VQERLVGNVEGNLLQRVFGVFREKIFVNSLLFIMRDGSQLSSFEPLLFLGFSLETLLREILLQLLPVGRRRVAGRQKEEFSFLDFDSLELIGLR